MYAIVSACVIALIVKQHDEQAQTDCADFFLNSKFINKYGAAYRQSNCSLLLTLAVVFHYVAQVAVQPAVRMLSRF